MSRSFQLSVLPLRAFVPPCLRAFHLSLVLVVGGPAVASPSVAPTVRGEIAAAFDELERTGGFERAEIALREAFDRVIAFAPGDEKDLFHEAALALRLARQLAVVDPAYRLDLVGFLRAHPELASTIVFLVKPGREKPAEVYAVLERLRRHRGQELPTYANLAAAICVVHDRPLERRINENTARGADPLDIFDYFVANERHTFFGVQNVPAELLVYVVDTTASVEEMRWALRRYAGDPVVGARFFDIDYDYDHFRKGKPKKVTVAGWNLPNILRYGGVCVDQAYFAMTVGKSIGVPTAYASGASSRVSHAWVGFLQAGEGRAWWNFDIGRYRAYQGVRGRVLDPQVRRRIPDSYVSLLAELATIEAADRWRAAAYTEAGVRLLELMDAGERLPAAPPREEAELIPLREADVESTLRLIEAGLRLSPGDARGWMVVRDLAAAERLTLEQKKRWAGFLHRLCGARYPDFYLAILRPMIESIDDVADQNALWNKAFALFGDRHDLAASVRMAQGRMWERAGAAAKAGACYEDVILRYADAGPFVVSALGRAEAILRRAGLTDQVLRLYERAFAGIKRPPDMAGPFYRQSNWYRVGTTYAERLEQAGQHPYAVRIRGMVQRR